MSDAMPIDMTPIVVQPGDLVQRLRDAVNFYYGSDPAGLLNEAADVIEMMAQRIEADDAAYKELERRHAD